MSRTAPLPLTGRTILVVEDEYFQAEDMEQALAQAGARLIGPCASVPAALEMLGAGPDPDAAVLDVNLRGQKVFPLAEELKARGIPLVFVTGYDPRILPQDYQDAVFLVKPYRAAQLIAALTKICATDRTGA